MPSSVQGKAKKDLHAIYQAENRESAEKAFDRFIAKYATKHDKAADCLVKDRAALLAFYDFPAEHPSQPPGCAHLMDRIKGLLAFDGSTCAPRIPSRAPSLPCGCGPPKPRAACHATPRSPLQGLLALSPLEIGAKASWPLRVFELAKSVERHWRKLDGANRLGQLIEGVEFRNGEPVQDAEEKAAA